MKKTFVKLHILLLQIERDLNEKNQKHGEIKNPKLEAVAELLKQKYEACVEKGGQKTAKGMLFTKTRENTKALKAWLDENPDLPFIKAERLVGTGKGEGQLNIQATSFYSLMDEVHRCCLADDSS